MKKIFSMAFTLLSLGAFAQNQNRDQPATPDPDRLAIQSSTHWLDLDYVGDGHTGHKLDIHLPKAGNGPFPVVISIYGSAWRSNSWKANTFTTGLGQKLLEHGFAVVSINYRSSSDARYPAQIHDVKAAIRYIRANADKFGLDHSFIGITGWSSGGHLAALAGTTNNTSRSTIQGLDIDIEGNLGRYTQTSSKVDAVVDWFGPTDFLIMDSCGSTMKHDAADSPESVLIGGPIQENADRVALANPISYIRKGIPPFLIFHGDKDPLVPHCQSEKLQEKLRAEGLRSELVIVPGGGHGPGVMINSYYDKAVAFFKSELKGRR